MTWIFTIGGFCLLAYAVIRVCIVAWPWLSAAVTWARSPRTPAAGVTTTTASITDEQAQAAVLVLARYKVQGKSNPAFVAVWAGVKAALTEAP